MACGPQGNVRGAGRGKKLVEFWSWISDKDRNDYCKSCRSVKKTKGTEPPCEKCDYGNGPDLSEINIEAMEIWSEVQTQWRMGPSGMVGLDYAEARVASEELEVEWCLCIKRKIQALERFELERAASINKRSSES